VAAEDDVMFRPSLEHVLWLAVLTGLYILGTQNYLLFHSLTEMFSIAVAAGIFMVAWNTRSISENSFMLLLGTAYLFVGGLDMVHTLAYKGMGVFPDAGANLPTQLWIAARYLEAVSIFVAARSIGRSSYPRALFAGYAVVTGLLLTSIFVWGVFPDCFVEGQGLTPFKVYSEYVICTVLIGAVLTLRKRRFTFEQDVYRLLVAALLVTVAEELAFTLYSDPYGPANLVGHLLKLVSFYLIYKAIVETGLRRPYELLFRDMKMSEERFKVMFDNAHDLISIADENGKVTWANPMWEQVLGYKPEMLENPAELIHPNDQTTVRDAWRSWRMGESEITDLEYRIKTLRGNYVTLETTVRKLEVGSESYTFTIAHDITERTKSEQRVRDSEEKFRTIFENSNDIVLFVDTSGLVVDVNDRLKDLTGYDPEEVIGRSFLKLGALRATDLPRLATLFKKAIETGELDEFNDVDITCKDGSTITLEVGTRFVRKGDRITGTVNIMRDVSERRRAEEKIRNLSRFPSENPNPVLRISKECTLIYANDGASPLLELCGGVVGRPVKCKEWIQSSKECLQKNKTMTLDMVYGTTTFSFVFAPVPKAGYVNVYAQDITERKKAEEEIRNLSRFPSENPNPVMRIAKGGVLLYANDASKALFNICGCKVGKRTLCERWYELVETSLKKNKTISEDFVYSDKTYSFEFAPVPKAGYVNIYVRDITERKKAEEELEQRLHDLGERVKEQTGLYTITQLFSRADLTLHELLQMVVEVLPPAWQYPDITCARIVLGGQEFTTKNYKKSRWMQSADIIISGKKGGLVEVHYLKKMPYLDEGSFLTEERKLINAIAKLLGNVIERKKAEEALKENEHQLTSIFESTIDALVLLDSTGKLIRMNKAVTDISGFTEEDLIGKRIQDLGIFPPTSLARIVANFKKRMLGKNIPPYEVDIKTKKGTRLTVEISASSVRKDGKVVGEISSLRDITERKIIEKELHDFRRTLENVVKERTAELEDAKNGLEFLSRTAMGFVQLGPEDDIWRYIGEQLNELVGDSVVFINSYDDESESFTCRVALGLGKKARKLTELLGREPEGMIIPIIPSARDGLKEGTLQIIEGGLHELSCESVPKQVCTKIEKLINMGQMYGMGLVREDRLFGSVTFVLRGDNTLKDADLVETFVNQVSVAVQRRLIEEELRK